MVDGGSRRVVLQTRVCFGDPFYKGGHYIWDLKRDPNLDNYP